MRSITQVKILMVLCLVSVDCCWYWLLILAECHSSFPTVVSYVWLPWPFLPCPAWTLPCGIEATWLVWLCLWMVLARTHLYLLFLACPTRLGNPLYWAPQSWGQPTWPEPYLCWSLRVYCACWEVQWGGSGVGREGSKRSPADHGPLQAVNIFLVCKN